LLWFEEGASVLMAQGSLSWFLARTEEPEPLLLLLGLFHEREAKHWNKQSSANTNKLCSCQMGPKMSEPLPQRRGEQKRGEKGNCDNSGQNKNKRERVQNMKDIQQAQSRQRIDHSFSRLKGKGRKCLFQCSLQLVAHRQTDTWLTIKAHFCHSELSSQ